jgi:hypothetical protein
MQDPRNQEAIRRLLVKSPLDIAAKNKIMMGLGMALPGSVAIPASAPGV